VLNNAGNDVAKNVLATFSSPEDYFDILNVDFGTISENNQQIMPIKLKLKEKALQLADDTSIAINFEINYQNSANQQFSDKQSTMLAVYGRNSPIGGVYPYSYTAFVSPHQNIIRKFAAQSTSGLPAGCGDACGTQADQDLAVRWLFESLKAYGMNYVNDVPNTGDYVQLPIETFE
jgi:hypothetical protein